MTSTRVIFADFSGFYGIRVPTHGGTKTKHGRHFGILVISVIGGGSANYPLAACGELT